PEQRAKFEAEKAAKLEAAKKAAEAKKAADGTAPAADGAEEDYGFEIDEKGRAALSKVAGDPEKKSKLLAVLKAKAAKAAEGTK
ncbi:MAG: hypothetical protein K2H87_02595, partial [Duncaniella sp.]|nr:hypothetical protein [Duncaniella sp.]